MIQGSTRLYQNNQDAIRWGSNGVRNAKHVSIRYNFLSEHVKMGRIELCYCPSASMLAEIFTKPLLLVLFCGLRKALGVCYQGVHFTE